MGSTADLGPTQAYDTNKTEVLRFLLVFLSRQIYMPPSSLLTTPSQYTLHFATRRADYPLFSAEYSYERVAVIKYYRYRGRRSLRPTALQPPCV